MTEHIRFRDCAGEFLETYRDVYATTTFDVRRRELMRLTRVVECLSSSGALSTEDAAKMTADDVKIIAAELRKLSISANTRTHMLGRLGLVCKFYENNAVDYAKIRYPTLFPPKHEQRLNVLDAEDVARILTYAAEQTEWRELRHCVSVVIPLATGARPQETRLLKDSDFNMAEGTARIEPVKGLDEGWGEVRTVPILPDAAPVISRYIDEFHRREQAGLLFQGYKSQPISGQTQRVWRQNVADATGVEFDHRILRRTWGQMLEDNGVQEEYVSVLLGHASTATTARYYARVREKKAIEAVRKAWKEDGNERKDRGYGCIGGITADSIREHKRTGGDSVTIPRDIADAILDGRNGILMSSGVELERFGAKLRICTHDEEITATVVDAWANEFGEIEIVTPGTVITLTVGA